MVVVILIPGGNNRLIGTAGSFPGQTGNPVGFTNTPASAPARWTGNATWPGAYPGSLTNHTGDVTTSGTAGSYLVIAFQDFTQAGGTSVTGSFIKFIGCRFQMQGQQQFGGSIELGGGSNHEFYYCSFVPLTSLHTQPPNGGGYTLWPTGGSGSNIYSDTPGTGFANPATSGYCIPYTNGYQYAIRCYANGNVVIDHCDFWGWGNCIVVGSASNNVKIYESWLHDARYGGATGQDHTDGIGYLDSGAAPANVTIDHCTVTSFGLEDGIAMQTSTSGYTNWVTNNCYLSGFDYTFFELTAPTSSVQVTNNIISGDIAWTFVPAGATNSWFTGQPNNNKWVNNTLRINPGNVDVASIQGSYVHYTSSQNGYFIYPDASYHATDFT